MTDAHKRDGRDFTFTEWGLHDSPRSRPMTLNEIMSLEEAAVRVLPGRMVTLPDMNNRVNWVPEADVSLDADGQIVPGSEENMRDNIRDDGWDLMYGYSGQVGGRHGVIMHPSEFIGGHMADDILDTPGVYVALEVQGLYPSEEENGSDDPIGWVVAYSQQD